MPSIKKVATASVMKNLNLYWMTLVYGLDFQYVRIRRKRFYSNKLLDEKEIDKRWKNKLLIIPFLVKDSLAYIIRLSTNFDIYTYIQCVCFNNN